MPAPPVPPRPQPKGLKVRYTPFGATNNGLTVMGDESEHEDVEMGDAALAAPAPATATSKAAAKKRKLGGEETAATPSKKARKSRVGASTPAVSAPVVKPIKETPIAPPPIPGHNVAATPVASSVTKSAGKDNKAKKTASKVTPIPPPVPAGKSA